MRRASHSSSERNPRRFDPNTALATEKVGPEAIPNGELMVSYARLIPASKNSRGDSPDDDGKLVGLFS
jgi:hypothetical protein